MGVVGWADVDDKFVHVNTACFDVGCLSSIMKLMYAPKIHLRKGAPRRHYYHHHHHPRYRYFI